MSEKTLTELQERISELEAQLAAAREWITWAWQYSQLAHGPNWRVDKGREIANSLSSLPVPPWTEEVRWLLEHAQPYSLHNDEEELKKWHGVCAAFLSRYCKGGK